MKLASVRRNGEDVVAIGLDDGRLLAAADLIERSGVDIETPRSMRHLISQGEPALAALTAGLSALAGAGSVDPIAFSPDRWYPPVRRPGKILAVAMNNSASNARKISAPDHPAFFLKPPSCLIGHLDPIRVRPYYGSVHPEPELALVIGTKLRDAPATESLDGVYGYTIFDDITGNGMRAEDRFHYYAIYPKKDDPDETERVEQHLSYAARYKGTDSFGVLGPWLVTRDEIADPDDLAVRCTVHGEVIAEDSTRYYNYKVAEVLSFISHFQTLEPGDVVSLGTAFKPGATRRSIHHANFQTVPGPIEITITGLGTQHNSVVIEDKALGAWRLE